jgi:hypothetical protein
MLTKLFNSIHRWFYPKTTQAVFNIVIDKGHYGTGALHRSDFMCIALKLAYDNGHITTKDYNTALAEIDTYIDSPTTSVLKNYLIERDLYYSFNDRLAIYRDWANRP